MKRHPPTIVFENVLPRHYSGLATGPTRRVDAIQPARLIRAFVFLLRANLNPLVHRDGAFWEEKISIEMPPGERSMAGDGPCPSVADDSDRWTCRTAGRSWSFPFPSADATAGDETMPANIKSRAMRNTFIAMNPY